MARFIIMGNINRDPDLEFMDRVFYFKLFLRNQQVDGVFLGQGTVGMP